MTLLTEDQMRYRIINEGLIAPFVEYERGIDNVSAGLEAFGYTARVGRFVEVATPDGTISEAELAGLDVLDLAPGCAAQLYTLEYFEMPQIIHGRSEAKSYWQRKYLLTFGGPLRPGWAGHLLVEVKNLHPTETIRLHRSQGIVDVSMMFVPPARYVRQSRYHGQGVIDGTE